MHPSLTIHIAAGGMQFPGAGAWRVTLRQVSPRQSPASLAVPCGAWYQPQHWSLDLRETQTPVLSRHCIHC